MTDIDNGSNELKRNLIDVSKYLELDTTFKMKVNIKNPFTEDSFEYDYVEHFCNGVPLPDLEPFLEARRAFEKTGKYCSYVKSLHPHSKYKKFWTEEKRRCVEGLQVGDTYISGYAYFYWNYTIIEIVVELENSTSKTGKKRSERITNFPDVYDSDYFFFKYIDNCENNGVHAALIKKRGWGYSFKIASMIARNYHLIPKSKSFVVADIKEFLLKDGTITKFNDMRGFLANNTAWGKRSQYKDTDIHKRASYKKKIDGAWTESGYKSEVIGISTNGNPDVLRGKRGKLSAYEEVGVNNVFRQSWMVQKSSVEEGDFVYGLLLAGGTGGCVCAGTKVYNKNKELVNIEDLKQSDGILGYDIDKNIVNPQTISWMQPPSKKECIKISTSTRFLECSLDHPILINNKWKKSKDIVIGDKWKIVSDINTSSIVEESIIDIEELGMRNIYNLTALENNTYLANGIITHNTEGADFEGLREVIDNPEVYFTYGVPDIFGGDLTRKRGFFVPGYVSVKGYYDKQGNSDIIGCALHLQQTRQYLRTNDISNQYVRFCAEHPFTVEEAVLKMEGSIFDVISIRERITNLATGKIKPLEYKGKFIRNGEGVVEFYEDLNANPIFKYPLDTTQIDISGCWVIWEHPYKEELLNNGRVVNVARYNRYVMGCDPIDIGEEEQTDTTKEHSLASTFVMDTWTKRIVAEYTGRPAKASDYYHQVILACEYFNGQVLYERNRSGFFTYCSSNNLLHWLADEPKTVREKFGVTGGNLLKGVQTVNRHMGKEYIQEYFRDTVYIDEVTKVSRIHTINSIPFLQECELYSPKKNLDRITAFGILMLFVHDINYQEEELIYKTSSIFEDKFFTEISRRVSKHAKSPI